MEGAVISRSFNPEDDLLIIEAMAGDLKSYLLSKTLYWHLSGGTLKKPFPNGTLGGTLLRLHRLEALNHLLTPEQYHRLYLAKEIIDHEFAQWPVQVEQKAVQEVRARLGLWDRYIDEYQNDQSGNVQTEYATQVRNRVILELLQEPAGRGLHGTSLNTRITLVDKRLEQFATEGPFVWDETLKPAFPADPYWWLYVERRPFT